MGNELRGSAKSATVTTGLGPQCNMICGLADARAVQHLGFVADGNLSINGAFAPITKLGGE